MRSSSTNRLFVHSPVAPMSPNSPHTFGGPISGKFEAHFNNDKRLVQRLAKFRTDLDATSNYSQFMPRLHRWLDELGFRRQLTMPSRAFCSDETQGCPTIQLKRQFGMFPFDHGVVGGLMACDRHGPHSHHGEDMFIIQASHVGVDDSTGRYGAVRRIKMAGGDLGDTCGKLVGAITPFLEDYALCTATTLATVHEDRSVTIDVDTQYLQKDRALGTVFKYNRMFAMGHTGVYLPAKSVSSIRASFTASPEFTAHLIQHLEGEMAATVPINKPLPIGKALTGSFFYCVSNAEPTDEPHQIIISNLLPTLPAIITHRHPALAAAIANVQAEFETSYRSISTSPHYKGRNLFYIAGVNIDVSPSEEAAKAHKSEFMRTRFIPWAVYFHTKDGKRSLIEQDEIVNILASFAEVTADETQHREESLFSTEPDRYGV